jgi:hypothetical protein
MKKNNLKVILITALTIIVIGCSGGFPTETKGTVPSDHTRLRGNALHKNNERFPYSFDVNTGEVNCAGERCHHNDLRGGSSRVNNNWYVAPSCYQCHGKVWTEIDSVINY